MIIGVDMDCLPIWTGRAIMAVVMCVFLVPAGIAPGLARADTATLLRSAAQLHVAKQAAAAYPSAHAEVSIGAIDPRLNLPPCSDLKLNLAPGSRLWGAGNLAAECVAPQPWKLYLSYKVTLKGPALLTRRPLPGGFSPAPGDLTTGVVVYAGDPGRYPNDTASLLGATLTRPAPAHQPITVDILRVAPVIKAGQKVRAVLSGSGFQVVQEGIAQSQAKPGETLRLKTPSGRFIQGVVQPNGTVRVQF
jgi:flagella basal body P-ring formation protein FlgA